MSDSNNYPPVTLELVKDASRCTYGGVASCHVLFAGKEVLRYEGQTVEDAQMYHDNVEWERPRLRNHDGVWEFVLFHSGGFTTLSLNSENPEVYAYTDAMFREFMNKYPELGQKLITEHRHFAWLAAHKERSKEKVYRRWREVACFIHRLMTDTLDGNRPPLPPPQRNIVRKNVASINRSYP